MTVFIVALFGFIAAAIAQYCLFHSATLLGVLPLFGYGVVIHWAARAGGEQSTSRSVRLIFGNGQVISYSFFVVWIDKILASCLIPSQLFALNGSLLALFLAGFWQAVKRQAFFTRLTPGRQWVGRFIYGTAVTLTILFFMSSSLSRLLYAHTGERPFGEFEVVKMLRLFGEGIRLD